MTARRYDVLISGAGPAGVTAALELNRLGYGVALLERQPFPRAHIGETLTPGVAAILDAHGLDAGLQFATACGSAGALRLWDRNDAATRLPPDGGFVIDRAAFDAHLLRVARQRGIDCLVPASGLPQRDGERWHAGVTGHGGAATASSRLWIDARGRQLARPGNLLATAPSAIAMWAEFAAVRTCDASLARIEALRDAWLWGAPTARGTYRVVAVSDTGVPRSLEPGAPSRWLREALAQSTLFRSYAAQPLLERMGHCAAGPYLHGDPWQPGAMKAGEAAFASDPLAGGGVEQAMRHALQCAVAAHTVLDDPTDAELARRYYLAGIVDAAARAAMRAGHHYASAWCAGEHPFWQQRVQARIPAECFAGELAAAFTTQVATLRAGCAANAPLATCPGEAVTPCGNVVKISAPVATEAALDALCVIDGKVARAPGNYSSSAAMPQPPRRAAGLPRH